MWLCNLCLCKSTRILECTLGSGTVSAFCISSSVTCSGRKEASLYNLPVQEFEMLLQLHKGTPCATNSTPELRGLWYLSLQVISLYASKNVAVFDAQDLRTSHVGLRQINGFSSLLSVFNNENSSSACPSPYSLYVANAKEPDHNSFSNVASVFSVMPSHIWATYFSCVCKVKKNDKDSECQEQAKR